MGHRDMGKQGDGGMGDKEREREREREGWGDLKCTKPQNILLFV